MIYGLSNNIRINAKPGAHAICPLCKTDVIPKCGEIKIWHFAHKSVQSCDPWHSHETDWHIQWKELFPPECREVVIDNHRADVLIHSTVVEFQHSPISPEEINERESFYSSKGYGVIWIFDAPDLSWWAEENFKRDRFYAGFHCSNFLWARPLSTNILHSGADQMLWVGRADAQAGVGVFIQRPLLVERFINRKFLPPANNLYILSKT